MMYVQWLVHGKPDAPKRVRLTANRKRAKSRSLPLWRKYHDGSGYKFEDETVHYSHRNVSGIHYSTGIPVSKGCCGEINSST